MKILRRTLVTVLSIAGILTAAPPAGAATNPYTPTEVCGAGYRVISSLPATTEDGRKWGGVYLLYKSGGYNCVVTIKWSFIGVATDTLAGLFRDSEDSSKNVIDRETSSTTPLRARMRHCASSTRAGSPTGPSRTPPA